MHPLGFIAMAMAVATQVSASCTPFTGTVTPSAITAANVSQAALVPGALVHVTATGITDFGSSSVAFTTGTSSALTISYSGSRASDQAAQVNVSYDATGNLTIALAVNTVPNSAGVVAGAATLLTTAATMGMASVLALDNDQALAACGLMASVALLANAACTSFTLNVSVELPAGLQINKLSAQTGSITYTIGAVPTAAPVTTHKPTTDKPTMRPSRAPTLTGQTYEPTSAWPTHRPTTSAAPTTTSPSTYPTLLPTKTPSMAHPSAAPSVKPTTRPTVSGETYSPTTTALPSAQPTLLPTMAPTVAPTFSPGEVEGPDVLGSTNFQYLGCYGLDYPILYYIVSATPNDCNIFAGIGTGSSYDDYYANCIIDSQLTLELCASLLPGATYLFMANSTMCLYSTMAVDLINGPYGDPFQGGSGDCTARCAGNTAQSCGRNGANDAFIFGVNVYALTTASPTTASPTTSPSARPTTTSPSARPTTTMAPSPPCFHDMELVELASGEFVPLKQVAVGDVVAAMDFEQGRKVFSQVYEFASARPNVTSHGVELVWADGGSLVLSAPHNVFASRDGVEAPRAVRADAVTAGMFMWVSTAGSNLLSARRVVKASTAERTGWVTPLTRQGTIVVNGAAASVYVYFDHDFAHGAWGPMRWWRSIMPAALGQLPASGKHWYLRGLHGLLRDNPAGSLIAAAVTSA